SALDRTIKSLGLHEVSIALHPEVSAMVTINVARSADEAERQLRGENVLIEKTDEELALEDAEALFDDAGAAPADDAPAPDDTDTKDKRKKKG
ncbi:MAG TPA: 50S ribosomal protein L9, partial [Alphaproteobacteria bacterium]|nr:50S ribosomal protein L9 [Alphaproteobacteria bacterium]